jgi:hypothetical protein
LIFGLLQGFEPGRLINFATACGALKHTVPGDIANISRAEIESFLKGPGQARNHNQINMKRLTNKQVYAAIEQHRFIPLFSHDDPQVCRRWYGRRMKAAFAFLNTPTARPMH